MTPLLAIALLLAPASRAGTVAVTVEAEPGEVGVEGVRAAVWHALYDRHGHDALVLQEGQDPVETMQRAHLTTLYRFEVSWDPLAMELPEVGAVGAMTPVVRTTEYVLRDGMLEPETTWTTYGSMALYQLEREHDEVVVALPQVALQEVVGLAVDPVHPPSWQGQVETASLPVVVVADEEYRAFYGPRWKEVADLRVERASVLLAQAGISLRVREHRAWTTPPDLADLSSLLDHLARAHPGEADTLVVAFTQQTGLERSWSEHGEDVGRAYRPGRHLVLADQALVPGHDRAWDEAEESSALAHELLHALGVPHQDRERCLMSSFKTTTVQRISADSRALARSALQARYAHWSRVAAMADLGEAAREHIHDPVHQVDYIVGNLDLGLGMPDPYEVAPGELSALTDMAMGRYYLVRSQSDPGNAEALRQVALDYSRAALEVEPDLSPAREVIEVIEALRRADRALLAAPVPSDDDPGAPAASDRSIPPRASGHMPWFGQGRNEFSE